MRRSSCGVPVSSQPVILSAHRNSLNSLLFRPDGRRLAGLRATELSFWDMPPLTSGSWQTQRAPDMCTICFLVTVTAISISN
jgi:hypothetical protein